MTENPFFEEWDTPFGMPPFDRIRPEHFPPAFDRGMDEQLAEIAAIVAAPEPPSFANTIEALERSGRLLDRVSAGVLQSRCRATPTRRSKRSPATTRPSSPSTRRASRSTQACSRGSTTSIARRAKLGLAADQLRLLERHHLRFVRAGALLGPEQKARMAAITERLATLHTLFGQNVLHDEREWRLVLDEADLDGLPDFARAAAAQAAAERGLAGRYVVTLVALLGRAVPDLLVAPRPAPQLRTRRGPRAATHRGRARQHAADPRDHDLARRAGAAARLSRLSPPIGSTTRWPRPPRPSSTCCWRSGSRPRKRRAPSGRALEERPAPRGSTSRSSRGTGAITPRRSGAPNTISMRPR